MKIAILTPTFSHFSGIDRVVEREAEDLSKKGYSITIFCFKAQMKTSFARVIELGMPQNSTWERIYRLFFFMDFFKIKKTLKKLKSFDKIICHQYPMTILAQKAKKKLGIRYIYHNAGVAPSELFSNLIERTYMRLFRYLTNKTIKKADEIISISKYLSQILEKETRLKSKVEYVKIDEKRFHQGVNNNKVRDKYGLDKAPVFLYVGRISPHKGIHLLIEAFNLVLKEIPSAKLLIVGKKTFGAYSAKLEKLAEKVNKEAIIFTNFIADEELPYFYAACNVYATASLWEGFDMPVVEAQACGKKVVAFDCGSHTEVVKNGLLVKIGDVQVLAKKMIDLIK